MRAHGTWLFLAGLSGLMGVAMGAAGAHAVENASQAALVDKASLYQLIHSLALLAFAGQPGRMAGLARLAWLGGIALFCGSLYLRALAGIHLPAAPLGGMLFMLGWFMAAFSGKRA